MKNKKDLHDIFDRASAKDLDTLINERMFSVYFLPSKELKRKVIKGCNIKGRERRNFLNKLIRATLAASLVICISLVISAFVKRFDKNLYSENIDLGKHHNSVISNQILNESDAYTALITEIGKYVDVFSFEYNEQINDRAIRLDMKSSKYKNMSIKIEVDDKCFLWKEKSGKLIKYGNACQVYADESVYISFLNENGSAANAALPVKSQTED